MKPKFLDNGVKYLLLSLKLPTKAWMSPVVVLETVGLKMIWRSAWWFGPNIIAVILAAYTLAPSPLLSKSTALNTEPLMSKTGTVLESIYIVGIFYKQKCT